MLKGELVGRWSHLKKNMQHLWLKFSENDFEVARNGLSSFLNKMSTANKKSVKPEDIHVENYRYESHRVDDLPLTILKDSSPGVKYSYTENSEFARDAEKSQAVGLDKFGDEEDTFDIEAADDFQDFRNRNQNSDLSKRFYTPGMDIDKKDLQQ